MNTDKRIEHTPLWFDGSTMRVKNNFNDTIAVVFEKHEGLEIVRACNRFYEMREALEEARQQIEYLHGKFQATGTGNNVLSRVESILKKTE